MPKPSPLSPLLDSQNPLPSSHTHVALLRRFRSFSLTWYLEHLTGHSCWLAFTVCFRKCLALLEVLPTLLLCYSLWKKILSTENTIGFIFDRWIGIAHVAFLSTPSFVPSSQRYWKSPTGSLCQLHPHSLSHSVLQYLLHLWLPDPCTSDSPCWFYDILICLYLKFQRNSHMDPRCWPFNARRCFLITQMWYVSKILALFSLWIT